MLEFSNPTRSKTIEIEIPAPASPKSLGYNGDDRSLGIGLKELRIVPPPAQGVDPNFVDFKQSAWPGVIFNARGLSQAEPWGTWSEGSAVSLEFAAPLPEKFAVHLVAHAFAADVGKEFVARVGNSTAKFTLGNSAEERVLEFSNPTRSKTIEIEIPAPASPKSLGYNGDDRSLGIGLKELRIVPPPAQGVDPNFVDFKQSAWPGVIFNARGLSQAEPWGTWSEGSAVSLEFAAPLPEKFAVHLVAHAFAADVGKEFVARVGNSTAKFTLGDSAEERVLEFSNPTRSKTIEIEIPAPASPKSLGYNGDDRSLGIGLKELRIVPPHEISSSSASRNR